MKDRCGIGAVRLCAVLLAACATDEPTVVSAGFDASAGLVEVFVAGDGFVTSGRERMPFDAFVLRMRQRTRAMTKDEIDRFVVHIRLAPAIPEAQAIAASKSMNRMLDELRVMGVKQARYL